MTRRPFFTIIISTTCTALLSIATYLSISRLLPWNKALSFQTNNILIKSCKTFRINHPTQIGNKWATQNPTIRNFAEIEIAQLSQQRIKVCAKAVNIWDNNNPQVATYLDEYGNNITLSIEPFSPPVLQQTSIAPILPTNIDLIVHKIKDSTQKANNPITQPHFRPILFDILQNRDSLPTTKITQPQTITRSFRSNQPLNQNFETFLVIIDSNAVSINELQHQDNAVYFSPKDNLLSIKTESGQKDLTTQIYIPCKKPNQYYSVCKIDRNLIDSLPMNHKYFTTIILHEKTTDWFQVSNTESLIIPEEARIDSFNLHNKTVYQTQPEFKLTSQHKFINLDNSITIQTKEKEISLQPWQTQTKGDFFIYTTKPQTKLDPDRSFTITVSGLIAEDSWQQKPQTFMFKTGNPPVLTSVRPTTNLSTGQSITINLSAPADKIDDIKVSTNNSSVKFKASPCKNKACIILTPTSNYPFCRKISVTVTATTTKNEWTLQTTKSFTISTKCGYVTSIGRSVKGRYITTYVFGEGKNTVLFFGAMHGNEANTYTLLYSWKNYITTHPEILPNNVRVVIIPTVNPDKLWASRFNAHNVDLNRNFPTSNWSQDSYYYGGEVENGGGENPGSEPETQAIINAIYKFSPKYSLSYHSAASMSIAFTGNSCSSSLARLYATNSRYTYTIDSNGNFTYELTGTWGSWMNEHGRCGATIELATRTSSEFYRNLPAMKAVLQSAGK